MTLNDLLSNAELLGKLRRLAWLIQMLYATFDESRERRILMLEFQHTFVEAESLGMTSTEIYHILGATGFLIYMPSGS